MGQSAGAGSPVNFACPAERRERYEAHVSAKFLHTRVMVREHTKVRTGRERPYRPPMYSALGVRSDTVTREYICSCGHRGWSNHKDLGRYPIEKEES